MPAVEHVVGIRPVKRMMDVETWVGYCTCGWTGIEHYTSARGAGLGRKGRPQVQSEAQQDALDHQREHVRA